MGGIRNINVNIIKIFILFYNVLVNNFRQFDLRGIWILRTYEDTDLYSIITPGSTTLLAVTIVYPLKTKMINK